MRGELDKALGLLKAAAEALPESVEARLALAECQLKLGRLDDALAGYRTVLKLSPNHAQAKQVVASLTGARTDAAGQLALAQSLIDLAAYGSAQSVLRPLVSAAIEPAQRDAAQQLLAEAQLWDGATGPALALAMQISQQSKQPAVIAKARIIAALALLAQSTDQQEAIDRLMVQAGEAAAPWAARAELVKLMGRLDQAATAEISTQLAEPLQAIPSGKLRNQLVSRAEAALLRRANLLLGQGDLKGAVAIVWPMASSAALPTDEAVLKPIAIDGGWSKRTAEIAAVLAGVGRAEHAQRRTSATLLGYWLAAEVLRDSAEAGDGKSLQQLLNLSQELAGISRAAVDRLPGTLLSTADQLQRALLLQLAELAADEKTRQNIVKQVIAHIQRYEPTDDLQTGLSQFVSAGEGDADAAAKLAESLAAFSPGAAQQQLLNFLAAKYAELGQKSFQKSAAALVQDANKTLNPSDRIALQFCQQLHATYAGDAKAIKTSNDLLQRYAAANNWDAALAGARIAYANLPGDTDAVAWGVLRLKLRQAQADEDRLLAASRALPNELNALVGEAIAETVKVLDARPKKPYRKATIALLDSLANRYSSLGRPDLAAAVIAAAAGENGTKQLADWSLWAQAQLLESRAAQTLARRSVGIARGEQLALDDAHQAELALLDELINGHPESDLRSNAVERVLHIASLYETYRSFDTARGLLVAFVETHPKLTATERVAYRGVQIALAKAQQAFDDRADKVEPPAALSAEHAAAVDAVAVFLKAYPTGPFSAAAEGDLFGVMRTYGQAGGWPVSREVLKRFAAAVPDYRRPQHLRLMEAATYLGQLDRQYGLSLLSPTPTGSGSSGVVAGESALALTFGYAGNYAPWSGRRPGAQPNAPQAAATANGPPGDQPDVSAPAQSGFGGGGGFARDPSSIDGESSRARPSETALAMIRQSQQRQFQQIAMLESNLNQAGAAQNEEGGRQQAQSQQAVAIPAGPVLSQAEMKRQDDVADQAYAILLELAKAEDIKQAGIADQARAQILWLFGFFEGQMRADRAIVLIERYLGDRPDDPARLALAYQAISDRIAFAVQRQPTERVDLAWLDERHQRFEQAREKISAFIAAHESESEWADRARLLRVDSYDRESQLAQQVSSVRAGGLLVQSVEALLTMLATAPQHPQAAGFPARLWSVADRLESLGQREAAIFVLNQVPIRFPVDALARQSILRIAQLHATNLSNPLKAVEAYQEFLHTNGDNESVRSSIFSIAQQLGAQRRYIESLHVYGVFVDSFPTDPRASSALRAIGQTHQSNEVWKEAIASYERVLDEYPGCGEEQPVKLAIAECQINLSEWRVARRIYEEYVQKYPQDGQVAMATSRMTVLKNLDRYQALLSDKEVQRNKDDAQFQIGRIVREQIGNEVKAVEEFRKVVAGYPQSDMADDAQLEIGRSLLSLSRLDEAREALLLVPLNYPNSPVADDALYLVGQSFEQQAQRLASVSASTVLAEAYERNQRGAYLALNGQIEQQQLFFSKRREQLKIAGKSKEIDLDEAASAFRFNQANFDAIANTSRQAEIAAETESALQVANRQDRINEALREAVAAYSRATSEYPLGDMTDESLLRIAQIFETELKDREAAMETYQKVVALFPGTPVAEDAAWKVATFYEQEGKFTLASNAYRDFIRKYPASGRVADAQFALAEVLEQLGKWTEAMDAYEVFRQKFAGHPKARLAVEQITWIKAYRK